MNETNTLWIHGSHEVHVCLSVEEAQELAEALKSMKHEGRITIVASYQSDDSPITHFKIEEYPKQDTWETIYEAEGSS